MKIWKPVEDGRYVYDSIIDGRFVLDVSDNGEEILLTGPEDLRERLNLVPFKVRLCQAVNQPDAPAAMTEEVREAIAWLVGFACNPHHMTDESLTMAHTAAMWLAKEGQSAT